MSEIPKGWSLDEPSVPEGWSLDSEDKPKKAGNPWEEALVNIENKMGIRTQEVQQTAEDVKSGEIGDAQGLLQTFGKGAMLRGLDVAGEAGMALAKDMIPDEYEPTIGSILTSLAQAGMETDTAKTVMEYWDQLDPQTQKSIEAGTGFAAGIIPKVRGAGGRVVSKADKVKVNRLKKLVSPLETKEVRKQRASGGFKEDLKSLEVAEELKDLKGLSPNKSFKANVKVLDDEINRTDGFLLNRLRTNPKKIDSKVISKQMDLDTEEVLKANPIVRKTKEYSEAFDDIREEMADLIKHHGKTPEGLLLARRDFDKLVRDPERWANVPVHELKARDVAAKILRRSVNKVVDAYAKNTDVTGILRRQHMIYRAWDNIGDKYAHKGGFMDQGMALANSHPLALAGVFGTGGGMLGAAMSNPMLQGAAMVGAPLYAGYKFAPQLMKGAGKALNTPVDTLTTRGMLTNPEEQK